MLQSINDWPITILTTEDYISEIERKISSTADKDNIEKWINNVDVLSEAWYIESLGHLLEIYEYFDNDLSINDIIRSVGR